MLGEQAGLVPFIDVPPTALDEVASKALAQQPVRLAREIVQTRKVGMQKTEQIVKGQLVAAMRCRRQHQEVPVRALGELAQQLEAPVPRPSARDRSMRLVNHHHLGAGAQEVVEPAIALDEVEAEDGEGIGVEDAHGVRQVALEPRRARCRDGRRSQGELGLQLGTPLIDQVRRAEDREALDLAAVDELAQDQAGLDRLADADVIGDQQPRGFLAERHHQRGELVGARLEVDPAGTSERAGAAAQGKPEGIAQEERRLTWAGPVAAGRCEDGKVDGFGFQLWDEFFRLVLGAGQGTQPQLIAGRENNPFATARPDQLAR